MILCTLLIVRFAANSLGCARFAGVLFGEFLTGLFDELFIDPRAGFGAFRPSSCFRVLAVPCAGVSRRRWGSAFAHVSLFGRNGIALVP